MRGRKGTVFNHSWDESVVKHPNIFLLHRSLRVTEILLLESSALTCAEVTRSKINRPFMLFHAGGGSGAGGAAG